MMMYLFHLWVDRNIETISTDVLFYGFAACLLVDVFLLSMLIYWFRVTFHG